MGVPGGLLRTHRPHPSYESPYQVARNQTGRRGAPAPSSAGVSWDAGRGAPSGWPDGGDRPGASHSDVLAGGLLGNPHGSVVRAALSPTWRGPVASYGVRGPTGGGDASGAPHGARCCGSPHAWWAHYLLQLWDPWAQVLGLPLTQGWGRANISPRSSRAPWGNGRSAGPGAGERRRGLRRHGKGHAG